MLFTVDEAHRAKAKTPHELYIVNVFAFHLLLTPAAIALGIGLYSLLLPPLLSGAVIGFIAWRARDLERTGPWFALVHWKLALRRCYWLLGAYAGSAAILLLVWLLTMGMENHSTRDIMLTVFTRIAIMPTFVMLLVTFVLEMAAIGQAGRGEVPDKLVQRHPAPEGVNPVEMV